MELQGGGKAGVLVSPLDSDKVLLTDRGSLEDASESTAEVGQKVGEDGEGGTPGTASKRESDGRNPLYSSGSSSGDFVARPPPPLPSKAANVKDVYGDRPRAKLSWRPQKTWSFYDGGWDDPSGGSPRATGAGREQFIPSAYAPGRVGAVLLFLELVLLPVLSLSMGVALVALLSRGPVLSCLRRAAEILRDAHHVPISNSFAPGWLLVLVWLALLCSAVHLLLLLTLILVFLQEPMAVAAEASGWSLAPLPEPKLLGRPAHTAAACIAFLNCRFQDLERLVPLRIMRTLLVLLGSSTQFVAALFFCYWVGGGSVTGAVAFAVAAMSLILVVCFELTWFLGQPFKVQWLQHPRLFWGTVLALAGGLVLGVSLGISGVSSNLGAALFNGERVTFIHGLHARASAVCYSAPGQPRSIINLVAQQMEPFSPFQLPGSTGMKARLDNAPGQWSADVEGTLVARKAAYALTQSSRWIAHEDLCVRGGPFWILRVLPPLKLANSTGVVGGLPVVIRMFRRFVGVAAAVDLQTTACDDRKAMYTGIQYLINGEFQNVTASVPSYYVCNRRDRAADFVNVTFSISLEGTYCANL